MKLTNKQILRSCMAMLVCAICSVSVATAQTVLLSENFDDEMLPTGWLNIDQDGVASHSGSGPLPQPWFFGNFVTSSSDTTEKVAQSNSWLTGFQPGNRNWLITTPVAINDSGTLLTWESAPAQVGLYQDGYTALISSTDTTLASFTDTIVHYRQNINDDPSQFSSGLDHTAFDPNPDTTQGFDFGKLQADTFNLDAYIGDTIYVAFLHDSDDDFVLAIDDVMITSPLPTGAQARHQSINSVQVFPNPVESTARLHYSISQPAGIQLTVYDLTGKELISLERNRKRAGFHSEKIDASGLPNGTYLYSIKVGQETVNGRLIVNK